MSDNLYSPRLWSTYAVVTMQKVVEVVLESDGPPSQADVEAALKRKRYEFMDEVDTLEVVSVDEVEEPTWYTEE